MLFTSISNISTSTAATGLSFGAPTTSAGMLGDITMGFRLKFSGEGGAASTVSTTTSTTTTTTVTTTTTTTTTTTSGLAFSLKPLTSPGINNTIPVGFASIPFTSTVNAIVTPVMTYGHLEDLVNKWSLELEDQEYFIHKATQVNDWDYTLNENAEKITTLYRKVEKAKLDQKRLEQELDFVLSQQNELENLLTPLVVTMKGHRGSVYQQHEDEDCERIYKLAENVDAQLKRMTQELRGIIEHLNIFGRLANTTGPFQQICKILSAHLDSLQWIIQNSGMLQRKIEEVTQVFKDLHCKEQEHNMSIAFD
ncbi:nucleoporin-62 C-terminal-like protein isoform X1 [Pteropus medius]|uniref:Nucleoporin-62 C-terminal-like protein n=1 Tax=Pteropus vampyrus TaxID=132908 RepID=A0A6P6BWU7_PTEVA|nr:nucleoporin-62 C-terminal-like protein [Pteropus vampyrus]XP_039734871.1 nucleoporin-62 C-terminal-like protein isoform X1 [Pteropus giganteus]XP_039734872.1 nucleoporin-62 C-terminal-like protein isoform X1 [Pteropus giganteus]